MVDNEPRRLLPDPEPEPLALFRPRNDEGSEETGGECGGSDDDDEAPPSPAVIDAPTSGRGLCVRLELRRPDPDPDLGPDPDPGPDGASGVGDAESSAEAGAANAAECDLCNGDAPLSRRSATCRGSMGDESDDDGNEDEDDRATSDWTAPIRSPLALACRCSGG